MSRTYTVTEYEKEDFEKLDYMTTEEVIETLEHIKRGWLPQNYVISPYELKTYTEEQYDITKLHVAMRKAIEILEQQQK